VNIEEKENNMLGKTGEMTRSRQCGSQKQSQRSKFKMMKGQSKRRRKKNLLRLKIIQRQKILQTLKIKNLKLDDEEEEEDGDYDQEDTEELLRKAVNAKNEHHDDESFNKSN